MAIGDCSIRQSSIENGNSDQSETASSPGMIGRVLGADWPAHDAVVLRATVAIVEAVLPDLAASGYGAVINVSSILGQDVAVDQGSLAYHASKAALDRATRWLASRSLLRAKTNPWLPKTHSSR